MQRKVIPEAELLAWMNQQLHQNSDYKDCQFTSVTRLAESDEIGCNWTNPNLRCSGTPAAVCQAGGAVIVERARQSFNVA